MSKKLSVSFLVCIVALMSMILTPAGYAMTWRSRAYVSGTFDYTYAFLIDPIMTDGKTFVFAEECETWTGDLAGGGHAFFIVLVYPDSGLKEVVLLSVHTTEVDGKEGTVVVRLIGKKPADGDLFGSWVILSGTGELENLRGQGIWRGPGYEGEEIPGERPDIYYSGHIRFIK
jgi:hypothetical protein